MQLKDLTPNPKNPRKISDKKLEMLSQSLRKFGSLDGIVFNKRTKRLVGGHQRQKVSQNTEIEFTQIYEEPTRTGTVAEGFIRIDGEKFPYREVDWDETTEKAATIAANKGAGEWEASLLTGAFEELKVEGFDLDLTMFDQDERDAFKIDKIESTEGLTDPDAVPEVKESIAKLGDIWRLGNHRLMCGDSTSIDAVEALMDGHKADMVFTDPPYNLQEHGQTKRTNKSETKTEKFGDWDQGFNPLDVLPLITTFTKSDAHQFVCTSSWLFGSIHKYFEDLKEKPNYLVWIKNNPMPSLSKATYVQSTELIVHSRKGSPKFNYPSGQNLRNILEGNVEPHSSGHPSQRPIYVVEYALNYTEGTVLDLFGGSGSTLIACEKTNRKCFMMELDPHYVDVIIARWENYTGQKATRIEDEIDG